MANLVETLTTLLHRSAAAAGFADAQVDPVVATKDPSHGDYQSNCAFRLAKAARTAPRNVAQALVENFPEHAGIARLEVAGPGFVNIHLEPALLGSALVGQLDAPALGFPLREGTVVIDYSSPNVAKRMHVGHLRSTVIGNALDRMMRFGGYTVIADNHIGDWGTQFGKLIVSWKGWRDEAAYASDPIGELQRIYQLFEQKSAEDPSLVEQARAETAKLQSGDADNRALWRRFLEDSMVEFNTIYERMGIHFDVTHGESHYEDMLPSVLSQLEEAGVAKESKGALVIMFDKSDGKGLDETVLPVRKSDGASMYGTTDLATVRYRLDTWSPSRILYVTDMRQQLHFKQIFAACRRMGWDQTSFEHVWFGMLTLPEGAMSSRKGNVINLRDLLDTAVEAARKVVDQNSAKLPEEERADIAEAVGVAAVRYADLSQNPQSGVVFEWDKMMAMDGNTAPFIMYSYARARSIQRRAGLNTELAAFTPHHPLERELTAALLRFPDALRQGLDNNRPNLLCDYLFQLSKSFNRFYAECRVLDAEGEDALTRRVLVEAAARTLGQGLELLGIRALERM